MTNNRVIEAIGNFYRDNSSKMKGYIMKRVRDSDTAEDLVQETFQKAIDKAHTFSEGTNLTGWLYTIARNTTINHQKKNSRWDSEYETAEDQPYMSTPEDEVIGRESEHLFQDVVENGLRQGSVDVLALDMLGYSGKEISEQLNISLGTAQVRLHRTRIKIEKALQR